MHYLNKWICFHFVLGLILCYYIYEDLISEEIPVILWWTPFMPFPNRYIECTDSKRTLKCLVTSNRFYRNSSLLKNIIFYGSHITEYDFPLPRANSVLWSLYHEESPKNFPALLYLKTQNLFNLTATFSRHSDYPLTLKYLINFSALTDDKYYLNVEVKNSYLKERAPILYIQSNCDTVSDRDILVTDLMKYINVDSYGKCLNNKEFPNILAELNPLDVYNEILMNFIAQYKFIISFENAICEDYISEKLWRSLIVGVIPIYLGSPSAQDWLPNRKSSAILAKDFKNMKSLTEYIRTVNTNDSLYNSYLDHKILKKVTNENLLNTHRHKGNEHDVLNFECFICKKVIGYSEEKRQNIFNCSEPAKNSVWYEHWKVAKYEAEVLDLQIRRNKSFSKGEFEETLLNHINNKLYK